MGYRVLDIETVPDFTVWKPGAPKWDLSPVEPIYFDTDESCPRPVPAGLVMGQPFPPPFAHRVVAISWVDMAGGDDGRYCFRGAHAFADWRPELERGLLEEFSNVQHDDGAMLVTWNGRSFDLPVLSFRSLKHSVCFSFFYEDSDMRYRYSQAGHIDLLDYLTDYGASTKVKLDDMARLIGLPGKTEITGSSVATLVAEKSNETMDKVRRYCLGDSLQTALLFLRSRVHIGKIGPRHHNLALASFRDSDVASRASLDIDWDCLLLPEAT